MQTVRWIRALCKVMSNAGPCWVLQHVSNWASECTQETYSVAAAWRWTLSKPLEDNTMASIKTLNGLIRTIQTLQPRTEQFMRGSTFDIVGLKSMQNRLTVGHQLWKYTQLGKRCLLDRDIQPDNTSWRTPTGPSLTGQANGHVDLRCAPRTQAIIN